MPTTPSRIEKVLAYMAMFTALDIDPTDGVKEKFYELTEADHDIYLVAHAMRSVEKEMRALTGLRMLENIRRRAGQTLTWPAGAPVTPLVPRPK